MKSLARQASKWSLTSMQDKNEIIALVHANYGVAYLMALRDLASDSEIEKATGLDITKFRNRIIDIQSSVTRKLAKSCPDYAPPDDYLANIATSL